MTPSDSGLPFPAPPDSNGAEPPRLLRDSIPIDQPARTSPLTVLLELFAMASIGLVLLAAVLAGADPVELTQAIIALVAVALRVVQWAFRTYTVTPGELIVDEGVLQRHHRVVPFSRIQQVELRQQLLARVLGIATIYVETAADAGHTAVSLHALELRRAEGLRDHLLDELRRIRAGQASSQAATQGIWSPPPPATERSVLVALTPGDLLLAGATSSATLGLAALVGLSMLGLVASDGGSFDTATVAAPVLVPALAFLVIVPVQLMVQWWGYRLSASGDDLHLEHGLLSRRAHTMPRARVQHAVVVDNPIRRLLGRATVRLHSAATPGRKDQQGSNISIPLMRGAAVPDLLTSLLAGDDPLPPPLVARPAAARRRAIVRRTALTSAFAVVLAALTWPLGAVALPLAAVGIPWGMAAHRLAGGSFDGPVLAVASGVVVRRLDLLPRERLQSTRHSTSPFQRRVALATLHLDVAGLRGPFGVGGVHLMDVDQAAPAP